MHGKLTVITGPMFSGKTEKLIRLIRQESDSGKSIEVFKPKVDDRYAEDRIVSHSKLSVPAKPLLNPSSEQANEHLVTVASVNLVAFDEVQFFGRWVVEETSYLLQRGIDVMTSGLDLTFQGHPFGVMPDLLCLADVVYKLSATCARCGLPANRSFRTAPWEGAVLVGGSESYEPRCLGCFQRAC